MYPLTENEIEEILEAEVLELITQINNKKLESLVTTKHDDGGFSYTLAEPEEADDYFTKEERELAAEQNIKLIAYMANKFMVDNYNFNTDELESVANVAFVKALNTYRKSVGMPFSTYACTCMHNEICSFITKEDRRGARVNVSLDGSGTQGDDGNLPSYLDRIEDSTVVIDENLSKEDSKNIINEVIDESFEPQEQFIIKSYFGFEGFTKRTQTELADMLHISQPAVLKKIKQIKEKIRGILKTKYRITCLDDIL